MFIITGAGVYRLNTNNNQVIIITIYKIIIIIIQHYDSVHGICLYPPLEKA